MNWQSAKREDALLVAAAGPINHTNADEFQARLLPAVEEAAAARLQLILNLEAIEYMSSVGLRVLMRAAGEARNASVEFALAGPNETMREIFQISRFDKLLRIFDSVDEALAG
jgi:anti-anti-sigma factor